MSDRAWAPRLSIRTFGCRLNQAESAALAAGLVNAGFRLVDAGEPSADVCVIHACAVTRTAERECLRWVRRLDRRRPRPLITLTGCLAQAIALSPADRNRIDLLVGQRQKWSLPETLRDRLQINPAPIPLTPRIPHFPGTRAWLRIQDGCDFNCAYCIVPRARGAPCVRPFNTLLAEARQLIEAGYAELVVTGANIGLYRDGSGRGLAELLAALAALPGLGRLRLGSIEPGTVETQVIDLMAIEPRLCRSLHLPLQSGDPGVLRAMRRRYTPEQYLETVRNALRRLPGLGLGTDLIAGFPGEDADAFEHTCSLVKQLPFANLHVFPYSERPGTPAATFGQSVPIAERKSRAARLIALGHTSRAAYAQRFKGRQVDVLIEQRGAGPQAFGYSSEYLATEIRDAGLTAAGDLVSATVRTVRRGQLVADIGTVTADGQKPYEKRSRPAHGEHNRQQTETDAGR